MSNRSTKKLVPRTVDGELARRIKELRGTSSQRSFADEMLVTQSQVAEWEKGSEVPSTEKLIAMGNIAKKRTDRMFFWRRAGFRESRLKEELGSDNCLSLAVPSAESSLIAPLAKRVFLGGAGELQIESEETLALPSILFTDSATVFSMKVPDRCGFPQSYPAGDYVAIEQASAGQEDLENSIVAIYFERTPEGYELSRDNFDFFQRMRAAKTLSEEDGRRLAEGVRLTRQADPAAAIESDRLNEESAARIEREMRDPVVLFGRLRQETAGGESELKRVPWEKRLTRVVLELTAGTASQYGDRIALSNWEEGVNPIKPMVVKRVRRPAHVIGQVVGWFRNRASSRVLTQRSLGTQEGRS